MRGFRMAMVGVVWGGLAAVAHADLLHVPDEYPTLSEACARAQPGDEIRLGAGVWSPSRTGDRFPILLHFPITIRGEGAALTRLDAETGSRHFVVAGDGVSLADLTLERGWSQDGGGSLRVESGEASLTAVRWTQNSTDAEGNAVWISHGTLELTNCLLDGNGIASAAVCMEGGAGRFDRCTFAANAGPAVDVRGRAHLELRRSVVAEPGVPSGVAAGLRVESTATLDLATNCFDGCFDGPLIGRRGAARSSQIAGAARQRGLRTGPVRFLDPLRADYRLAPESGARESNDDELGAFGGDTPVRMQPVAGRFAPERHGPHTLLRPSTPNPTHRETTVHFTVPVAGVVDLGIYNVLGQRIRSLLSQHLAEGDHSVMWDGRDEAGEALPPGIFFVRVTQGTVTESRRLVLVR